MRGCAPQLKQPKGALTLRITPSVTVRGWKLENSRASGCHCSSSSKAFASEDTSVSDATSRDPPSSRHEPPASASTTIRNPDAQQATGAAPQPRLLSKPSVARKLLGVQSAAEAAEIISEELGWESSLTAQECLELLNAALDKGNVKLAMSIHSSMCASRRPASSQSSMDMTLAWPPATIQTTSALVLGLCKQLAITEAIRVVAEVRVQGLPRNDEVGFGKVIGSPLAPGQTLTVVQPQEGFKLVADAYSKYEYEVFSGTVITCTSEALNPQDGNILLTIARAVGLLRKPAAKAVHSLAVKAPDGTSRTFRVATENAGVPALVNDRVTFVCSPAKNSNKGRRGLLTASPPGTAPGEPMQATNHKTGVVTSLLRPPTPGAQSGIPSWYLPAAVIFAGSDMASSLLDPSLPALIAAGAAFTMGSAVAGNTVLLPRLKQFTDKEVSLEYMRQRLLGQYSSLAGKLESVTQEANEDIRVLARLWQLENKMASVSQASTAYSARMERVAAARTNIEERLSKKLELLDGYGKVMNMIEIEVEMDIEVPAAELAGIEMQLTRLEELESLQDDWRVQAEARDEVERLLKAA